MSEPKILLVTGASADIGEALISRVVTNYDMVLCHFARSATKVGELHEKFGDKIVPLQADFSILEETDSLVAEIIERNLIPSHFVHLPAIKYKNVKFHQTEWSEFENQMAVQVRSAYTLCKAFLPTMAKRRFGRVVFMLTENVVKPIPGKYSVPYTMAKSALYGLMKCLAAEYAEKGITVNAVSPSMIETDFISDLPEIVQQLNANNSPMKRNLSVNDVVPAFEYLLSDDAGMITGHNIPILGGK
jgi:3-oxoacyl-[acyl-carrier protein] reductase